MFSRTNKIKCQNKWKQLSEQDPSIVRISLYAILNKQIKYQNKYSLMWNKYLVGKKNYSQNKFVCHLEQNKYSVRTNQNKGSKQVIII
jgi:hypothetical protein